MTDYYLPALANGEDFRPAVGVNYHDSIGNSVSPQNPIDTNIIQDEGAKVWNDGSIRACSTARGAVALACCFSTRALSDCSFFKVTGEPIAVLTDSWCSNSDLGHGSLYAFKELTIVSEYTIAQIRTAAGLPADWNGLGK